MYCPHCGANVPDGAAFCPTCGEQMQGFQQSQIAHERGESNDRIAGASGPLAVPKLLIAAAAGVGIILIVKLAMYCADSAGHISDILSLYSSSVSATGTAMYVCTPIALGGVFATFADRAVEAWHRKNVTPSVWCGRVLRNGIGVVIFCAGELVLRSFFEDVNPLLDKISSPISLSLDFYGTWIEDNTALIVVLVVLAAAALASAYRQAGVMPSSHPWQ